MTKKDQPEVEIEEKEEEEPSGVIVDLEEKPKEEDKKEEPKPVQTQPDLSKLHNTIAYQTRQLEKAMKELQDVRRELASSNVPKESEIHDEIDEIAQRDWKAGVTKLVEKNIENRIQDILQKKEVLNQESKRRELLEGELEKSKQKVIQKYPSIEDTSTEEARLYMEVINEDNSLLSNVHGPEVAMYRMEEKMRQMGKTPPAMKPIVDREVSRLVRAGASSVVGKTPSPSGKITLTREQKEFCDHYKIPYEQYAKNLRASEALGGVES